MYKFIKIKILYNFVIAEVSIKDIALIQKLKLVPKLTEIFLILFH